MNPTHASNGANALAALNTQRLLDGRQLGNGGREFTPTAGPDGPGFASMLKSAQQASGGANRETASPRSPAEPARQAATPPDAPAAAGAFAQARRAEPPRTPSPQTRATEAALKRAAPGSEHEAAAAESDPAKPAIGSPDTAPQPSGPVKAKARSAAATAAVVEAVPTQAVAAVPVSTIALPEEALQLVPSATADSEQALNPSQPATPTVQSAPLPPSEAAVLTNEALPVQDEAPSLQAPSNALPLAPSRRAIDNPATERGPELSPLAGLGSKSNETPGSVSRPSASSSAASALPERIVGAEAQTQVQTGAVPAAVPQAVLPASLKNTVAERHASAEMQADASMVKGTFSLAGLASTPAPGLQSMPTGNVQATVYAPLASPAFADELGAQVAIWSRQGVQEAELRLNPAEMGPVQVRIQLEGQVAQVRFVAEQGPTRDALQAALPELVQALSNEGLQWGGGDVQSQSQQQAQQNSQHSAQQQAESRSNGQSQRPWRSATGLAGEPQIAPPPPGQRVGLLDLYA